MKHNKYFTWKTINIVHENNKYFTWKTINILYGAECWFISGYKCFKGQVLNAADIECLYDGLKQNNIHGQFSHLLTGSTVNLFFFFKSYFVFSYSFYDKFLTVLSHV
jgi:hypothetical protein